VVNQTVGCRGKNVVYLIAVIIATLFCFGGCSNENQTKESTTKPPLTDEVIEQTLKKHSDNWKRYDLNIDAETAAK
jgi:PBP1b-binding outer membrane lipoprotein LpoB